MNQPFISFLVTSKNEGKQLSELFDLLFEYKKGNEIVLLDDYSDNHATLNFIKGLEWYELPSPNISFHQHALNNDYGSHKNYGKSLCKGQWIMQIDADELPTETLLLNMKPIIDLNPTIDLFWISRINDFKGVTDQHAKQFGWRLTTSPTYKIPLVNWPDCQGRLFRNKPELKWEGRLHERIVGYKTYAYLPVDEQLALYHTKTIEKQVETNMRYQKSFTKEENMGFQLPKV